MKKVLFSCAGLVLLGLLAAGLILQHRSDDMPVVVTLAGDVLLDRGVGRAMASMGQDYPYGSVRSILSQSDIAFANLECTLTEKGTPALKRGDLVFKADPSNATALKKAGFTLLNLANNHILDYGHEGLQSTMDALARAGLRWTGAGADAARSREPVLVKVSGVVVGFLGYTLFPGEGVFYDADKASTHLLEDRRFGDEIRSAKKHCDILVVSVHWGDEFGSYPVKRQKKLAHLAVDSGADVVVGHHPHVLQGVERYKTGTIFYSLGNFIFDHQDMPGTDETVMVRLTANKRGVVKYGLIPAVITDCRPEPVSGLRRKNILSRMASISRGMNPPPGLFDD